MTEQKLTFSLGSVRVQTALVKQWVGFALAPVFAEETWTTQR